MKRIMRRGSRAWRGRAFRLAVKISRKRREAIPPQIFFLHIPKSAGQSVNLYLKTYFGSSRSKQSVVFNDIFTPEEHNSIGAKKIEIARSARFITGHYSWAVFKEIRPHPEAFVFTFLRDPVSRLLSLYNYAASVPVGKLKTQIEGMYRMKPDHFFTSNDPRIRHALDNYVTRQFSGTFDLQGRKPVGERELNKAIYNMESLDLVGFVERFNIDFPKLLTSIGLPNPKKTPHANKSAGQLKRAQQKRIQLEDLNEETKSRIEQYTRYDRMIYERFASRGM